MGKIIAWVLANGATLIGLLQAIVKAIKELMTGVVNLLSLFMPQTTTNKVVDAVRGAINKVDELLETIKGFLLK